MGGGSCFGDSTAPFVMGWNRFESLEPISSFFLGPVNNFGPKIYVELKNVTPVVCQQAEELTNRKNIFVVQHD